MNNETIIVARREDSSRSIYGPMSTFVFFSAFLILDIYFYTRDKATWQLVLLIITASLDGLVFLGFLFALSNYRYSKKIVNTPLITFDELKNSFVVTDCLFHKELEVNKADVLEVKISDKGETYLWYNKDAKKASTFIGYSTKGREDLINNEIQKYKNLY